jgi:hypothetical protein
VRIGEFAWSRLEPGRGEFCWEIATPPKWLMDEHPDIAPVDIEGRPRGFGSRRHYTFSSTTYVRESARVVEALAKRYGAHPALARWQIDNEYGCHDTVLSYGPHDAAAFRDWLRRRYQSPEALNVAWGAVFWSMEVGSFNEVALPNLRRSPSLRRRDGGGLKSQAYEAPLVSLPAMKEPTPRASGASRIRADSDLRGKRFRPIRDTNIGISPPMSRAAKRGPPTSGLSPLNWRLSQASGRPADSGFA